MFRKILFLASIIVLGVTACIPVGQLEVGVEPVEVVNTPVLLATPTESVAVLTPGPVVNPGSIPGPLGTVEGDVCYPSEMIPQMTAYFRNIATGSTTDLWISENQASYSVNLPAGEYIAFAYLDNVEDPLGGHYSEFVPCGLSVECVDHSPLPFEVLPDQVTGGVNLCDWYEPAAVPSNPKLVLSVSPDLEGFVFISNETVYRVETGGNAYPVLSPYRANEIVISDDGSQAVFTSEDDLYLADLNVGTWVNLTNTPDRWEQNPVFVPGDPGSVFFYTGTMDEERMGGSPAMVRLDGNSYEILDLPVCCTSPSFDSTGSRMAFTSGDAAWIYDLGSSELTGLDMQAYGIVNLRYIVSPSFSPDGSKLAYWMVLGTEGDSSLSLGIFDLEAKSVVLKHSYQPIGGGGANSAAAWSPDGNWVATTALGDGGKANLWLISVNTDEEISLGMNSAPVWRTDSSAVVYRVWPENGGPAWDSTIRELSLADRTDRSLEFPLGVEPVGFPR